MRIKIMVILATYLLNPRGRIGPNDFLGVDGSLGPDCELALPSSAKTNGILLPGICDGFAMITVDA